MQKEDIEIKSKEWNLKPLKKGKNFEEKRIDWKNETDKFVNKWKKREDYLENPVLLKEALDEYEKWKRNFGEEYDEAYYYWLKTQINQNDKELKAKFNEIEEFSKKIGNKISFFTLNISKIQKEKQDIFLKEECLKDYNHFLERLFANSKHFLTEKEENILSLKSSTSYSLWVKMTSEFLSKEEREVLDENEKLCLKSFSEILSLLDNKNKKIRDSAANAFNSILDKHKEIAEYELNSILGDKKTNDDLRRLERPDSQRHLNDDIESEVIDKLIESVSKRYDLSKRYYKLKSKLLGFEKLEYHERNIEIGDIDKKFSYEESINLVNKVFKNLDEKFSEILKKFVENEQIDVFPIKGKKSGAFCVHFLPTQPTYVMLNHTNKLNDVLTLAHEMGHAINNELIKEKQNSINFGTPLSTAEVSSTFMEDFVLSELIKDSDEKTKLSIIMQKLNDDISTIFRQIACYKFEKELHKEFRRKGYLSYKEIGNLFQKHMKEYMGDYVNQSKGSENWWVYWSHIRTFFYVYSYASGLLISKSMQRKVRENPKFISNVKEFLSTGLSNSPKNAFLKMGIDLSKEDFWEDGIKEIEELLSQAEELTDKILNNKP